MKIVCVKTPRKFIMASDTDNRVVAKPPSASGAYTNEGSMLVRIASKNSNWILLQGWQDEHQASWRLPQASNPVSHFPLHRTWLRVVSIWEWAVSEYLTDIGVMSTFYRHYAQALWGSEIENAGRPKQHEIPEAIVTVRSQTIVVLWQIWIECLKRAADRPRLRREML